MIKSESVKELAIALAKAHSELSNPKKESINPFFKSKYADLAEVINVSKKTLADNGLSITQMPSLENGIVSVETLLLHSSGEYISSIMSLLPIKTDPQSIGTCITYIRRYSLAAVLNIAQEDDDANSISTMNQNNNVITIPSKPNPDILKQFKDCKTINETLDAWKDCGKLDMYKSVFGHKYTELKNKEESESE